MLTVARAALALNGAWQVAQADGYLASRPARSMLVIR